MNFYLSQMTRRTTDTKFRREESVQIKSYQAYFSVNKAAERKKLLSFFGALFMHSNQNGSNNSGTRELKSFSKAIFSVSQKTKQRTALQPWAKAPSFIPCSENHCKNSHLLPFQCSLASAQSQTIPRATRFCKRLQANITNAERRGLTDSLSPRDVFTQR